MASIKQRLHSGEHILAGALIKLNPELKTCKVDIRDDDCSVFIISKEIDWNVLIEAEKISNSIISEKKPIEISNESKSDAENSGVRGRFDRIEEENFRIVEIKGHDKCACAGEHCKNTDDVKSILITSFNSLGNNEFEIKFKVDSNAELFTLAGNARKSASILGCESKNLSATCENLKYDLDKYKKMSRELSKLKADDIKEEKINDILFYSHEFEDFEKKQLFEIINKLKKENTFIAFINKTKRGSNIMISSSTNLEAGAIVKSLAKKFNGKGGGGKDFAMGSVEEESEKVFDEIRVMLK